MTNKSKSSKRTKNVSAKNVSFQVAVQPRSSPPKKKKKGRGPQSASLSKLSRFGWTASLIDPFGVSGYRIPDAKTAATATAQLRDRITVACIQSASTGQYGAGFMFRPSIANSYSPCTVYTVGTGTFFFATAGGYTDFSQRATINALMSDYRVVSAGFNVFSTANFVDNQGRIACAFWPSNTQTVPYGSSSGSVTMASTLTAPNMSDSPMNAQKFCSVTWVPSDVTNYNFNLPPANPDAAGSTNLNNNVGALYFVADGLQQSISFEIEIVINIEYHPVSSAISLVNPRPSRYDVVAMEQALNHPIISNMFHHVPEDSIMTNTAGANSPAASSWIADIGSGFKGALDQHAYAVGRALGNFGANYASNAWTSSGFIDSTLQGLPFLH